MDHCSRCGRRAVVTVLALQVALSMSEAPARPAAAAEVSAGWAISDVGLDGHGGGLVLGVGSRAALVPSALDLAYALEYVQKRGSQPTWFTAPNRPFLLDDAVVTLHVAQPVALLELTAVPLPYPRPYAGLSVALKLSEKWSAFPGVPSSEWGYRDVDFVAHAGLTRQVGPLRLDLRYSHGLTDQLIVDPVAGLPVKAVDPLPGVKSPEVGARLSLWQAAVVLAF